MEGNLGPVSLEVCVCVPYPPSLDFAEHSSHSAIAHEGSESPVDA
jgi:hypothetical protein